MNKESQRFTTRIALADLAATEALGARIAAGLHKGDVVALQGDLGTGKTTLARAILRALDVAENVPSPTFTLAQTYETRDFPVRHFDLYRIENAHEVDELGLDDALDEGAALVEWPERATGHLPGDHLHILLTGAGPNARLADVSGPVRWAGAMTDITRGP
jgi:tRNA threonylcarbamoyl adenosine modification protein YjeE